MLATPRMRSASATDEPPNFITTEYCSRSSPGWTTVTDESAAAAAWTRIARAIARRDARGDARDGALRHGANGREFGGHREDGVGDRGAVVSPLASWRGNYLLRSPILKNFRPRQTLLGFDRGGSKGIRHIRKRTETVL